MNGRRERADDERAAASLQVTISTYVMAAGLAILAGTTALLTFYLQFHLFSWLIVLLHILVIVLAVIGFLYGGWGINQLSKNGYEGNWSISAVGGLFNKQAILTLLAVMALILTFILVALSPAASGPTH